MVRLRSGRWYSSEGQSRIRGAVANHSSGARRLLSLCFLLALVILLMQKATDPKHVSRAFRALGVPLEEEVSSKGRASNVESSGKSPDAAQPTTRWKLACNDIVQQLFEDATNTEILAFARGWFQLAETPDVDRLLQLRSTTQSKLNDLKAALEPDQQDWLAELERLKAEWGSVWPTATSRATPTARASPELENAVTDVLDRRLTLALKDASVWQSSEATAFWRLLQRGQGRGRANSQDRLDFKAPRISTLQLESEIEIYKTQTVRFQGSVRRVEHIPRENTQAGIESYWLLWLRGADESPQPVAIYSTSPQVGRLEKLLGHNGMEFPEVEITGVVGKRLAYPSQMGIQVAPTIFASRMQILTQPGSPSVTQVEPFQGLPYAIGLGTLLAALILLPVLWNWRRRTVRSRWPPTNNVHAEKQQTGKAMIWLLCAGLVSQSGLVMAQAEILQNRSSAQSSPWGKASDPTSLREELFRKRLTAVLENADLSSIDGYLRNNEGSFPADLLKTMGSLRQLGFDLLPSKTCTAETKRWRLTPVRMSGIARLAMPIELSADQRQWFLLNDSERLVRVQVENSTLGDLGAGDLEQALPDGMLTVVCQQVPEPWLNSPRLKQPFETLGFALLDLRNERISCVLAASADWIWSDEHFDRSDWSPALTDKMRTLGKLGLNLTLLDEVADRDQKSLSESESEIFYSFLNALAPQSGAPPLGSSDLLENPMSVLSDPVASVGAPVRWKVRLVTGSVVQVDRPQAQRNLDGSRYFQFDGFVDIGNRRIRYQIANTDDYVSFEREFPVTLVSKVVPSGLAPDGLLDRGQLSWEIGQWVDAEGCFYRMWSYQSELLEQKSTTARQAAPLVIASKITKTNFLPERPKNGEIGWFGYALCVATLVILGAILFTLLKPASPSRRLRG